MSTQADFQTQLDRINAATNSIAAQLNDLKEQIAGAGLTEEVENSVLEQLTNAANALEAVGAPPPSN